MMNVLSLLDEMNDNDAPASSNLNVNAAVFQPAPAVDTRAQATSPHASAQEVESPDAVAFWMDAYGNVFDAYGNYYGPSAMQPDAFYQSAEWSDGMVDESTGYYLGFEDQLRDGLYNAPQQPKGNTYGLARSHQGGRWAR